MAHLRVGRSLRRTRATTSCEVKPVRLVDQEDALRGRVGQRSALSSSQHARRALSYGRVGGEAGGALVAAPALRPAMALTSIGRGAQAHRARRRRRRSFADEGGDARPLRAPAGCRSTPSESARGAPAAAKSSERDVACVAGDRPRALDGSRARAIRRSSPAARARTGGGTCRVTSTPSSISQAAMRCGRASVLSWMKWPVSDEADVQRARRSPA